MGIQAFDTFSASLAGLKYLPYSVAAQAAAVSIAAAFNFTTIKTAKEVFFPPSDTCATLDNVPLTGKVLTPIQMAYMALGEEVAIRGVVQDGILTRALGQVLRVFGKAHWIRSRPVMITRVGLSAALFSAMHLGNIPLLGLENVKFQLANTFGMGVAFAAIKEKTGSLWPAYGMHAAWNLLAGSTPLSYCGIVRREPSVSPQELCKRQEAPNFFVAPSCHAKNQNLIDTANEQGRLASLYQNSSENLMKQAQASKPQEA